MKALLFVLLIFVLSLATGFVGGYTHGEVRQMVKAVEAGAAHYKCDSRTAECVFTWGPPEFPNMENDR